MAALREAVGSLEPGCFTGEQAAALVALFADGERLAGVGRALMARRVEETNLWRREGQRSALEQRDPECVVAGCHVGQHLEIDHVAGWALTRVTTVDRLARLCAFHHHRKTYCGYRLVGRPGAWEWRPPQQEEDGCERSRPPPELHEPEALPLGGRG